MDTEFKNNEFHDKDDELEDCQECRVERSPIKKRKFRGNDLLTSTIHKTTELNERQKTCYLKETVENNLLLEHWANHGEEGLDIASINSLRSIFEHTFSHLQNQLHQQASTKKQVRNQEA